jgi:hypothetical protein
MGDYEQFMGQGPEGYTREQIVNQLVQASWPTNKSSEPDEKQCEIYLAEVEKLLQDPNKQKLLAQLKPEEIKIFLNFLKRLQTSLIEERRAALDFIFYAVGHMTPKKIQFHTGLLNGEEDPLSGIISAGKEVDSLSGNK